MDESCDYLFSSRLNFIVLFTSFPMYNDSNGWIGYTIFDWIVDAKQKYGDQFLGIYRFDEPGGNQLDNGTSIIIYNTRTFSYPDNPTGYAEVSEGYVGQPISHSGTIILTIRAVRLKYSLRTTGSTGLITSQGIALFWLSLLETKAGNRLLR